MYAARLFLLLSLLVSGSPVQAEHDHGIRIGTGQRGGNDYSSGGAICRSFNQASPHGCTVMPTDGSIDNLYALYLEDVDFAILQQDLEQAARLGNAGLPGDYGDLRSVASLYTETLTVVTRADSDIASFGDLKTKRVAAGAPMSGMHWTFRSLLQSMSMNVTDMTLVEDKNAHDGRALCSGALDAVVMMTGHPSVTLSRLGDACAVRIVPLGADEVGIMASPDTRYRPMTVPSGIYSFVDTPVPTIGTDAVLVTRASTPDAQVQTVLAAMFDNAQILQGQESVLSLRPVADERDMKFCHRAAIEFYSSRGY